MIIIFVGVRLVRSTYLVVVLSVYYILYITTEYTTEHIRCMYMRSRQPRGVGELTNTWRLHMHLHGCQCNQSRLQLQLHLISIVTVPFVG